MPKILAYLNSEWDGCVCLKYTAEIIN
jgi:hypothetical protein